jgi:hypothetical protein
VVVVSEHQPQLRVVLPAVDDFVHELPVEFISEICDVLFYLEVLVGHIGDVVS